MDGLTALIAKLIASLRSVLSTDVCPGDWAWAVSAWGIAVGLLPTAGLVTVALLRKRIGSRYGVGESALLLGIGLVSAGLLPLLAFMATGRVFSLAAAERAVPGLTGRQVRSMSSATCFGPSQADYLGSYPISDAFSIGEPTRLGPAIALLVLCPLLAATLVGIQARLTLRRGPSWPAKCFWIPLLAVPFLGAAAAGGAAGQLWAGAVVAGFVGIPVVLLAGVPSRETVRRSLAQPEPRRAPAGRQQPSQPDRRRGPEPVPAAAAGEPEGVLAAVRSRLGRANQQTRTPTPTLIAPTPSGTGRSRTATPGGAPARFQLIRRLGAGGFGRVWLAHDAKLGHQVALKSAHAPDAETEQRIQREAKALAAIRHPNCVRIYDLIHASSDPGLAELEGLVIVMEYVDGEPLGALVRNRGVLDDVSAARVWAGVGGALDAAHQLGVMHRDVKPGNIVLDSAGVAHLIDFGIARSSSDSTMTMAGFVLGTPDFLAPEVARGERATPASDSWQLAATVSFALTGVPPRGNHADAMSGLRAAAVGAPPTHLPQASAHTQLLRAALDAEAARRPPLRVANQALTDWMVRVGVPVHGPVSAAQHGGH